MGGGAVGGGAGPPGRVPGPLGRARPTRVLPVGVARRRRWRRRAAVALCALGSSAAPRRGCGACGAIRVQHAGSPSGGWWLRRRLTTGRSLPYWVEGRGGLPGGRCRGGGHGRGIGPAVGPSPCVSPKCRPCALSCQPAALCEAGAAARALRAGGQVCLGLAAAGAVPHSHRGAPVRPACRRGAAVGVAADMIPVHSDPPVFRRRAAMSQFPAAKDYPARATTPAPRRGGEATLGSFAKLTSTCTCVYCDIDL